MIINMFYNALREKKVIPAFLGMKTAENVLSLQAERGRTIYGVERNGK